MAERRSSYEFDDLLACGRGELFGPGNAQLPLPPMLMFDRIAAISDTGGAHGKGQIVAELAVAGNSRLDWFFDCHFQGDPVMRAVSASTRCGSSPVSISAGSAPRAGDARSASAR